VVDPEWHQYPKDDAWRQVHLAHVENLGARLWLRCNDCGHSLTPAPRAFAQDHHLEMRTPLLTIARRLRCTCREARKAHCWPEPYGIPGGKRRSDPEAETDSLPSLGTLRDSSMDRYQALRSIPNERTYLICHIEELKSEYRRAIAREGYALVECELAVFEPEA
jgi:hypothetical protein